MDKVTVDLETGFTKYPYVMVTYDGNYISRFYRDEYLRNSVLDAIKKAGGEKDVYDFATFLFGAVNQAVKRHYRGQELMLESVEVTAEGGNYSVMISR